MKKAFRYQITDIRHQALAKIYGAHHYDIRTAPVNGPDPDNWEGDFHYKDGGLYKASEPGEIYQVNGYGTRYQGKRGELKGHMYILIPSREVAKSYHPPTFVSSSVAELDEKREKLGIPYPWPEAGDSMKDARS